MRITWSTRVMPAPVGRATTTASRSTTWSVTTVDVPVYPDHTVRSVFINQRALPTLVAETIQKQSAAMPVEFPSDDA
jgi:hypothetical protein